MLSKIVSQLQSSFVASVPSVIGFLVRVVLCIVIYLVGRKVILWLIRLLRRMMKRANLQEGAITFSCSVVKILLYCALILGIALELGVKETSVAALIASVGVAIGLAFRGGLSNLAGGFLILIFQPFHVGDYIICQEQEGTVQKIEIMYTTLLTTENRRITVPNSILTDNILVNVTAEDKRRMEIEVGISYSDDIDLAKDVLEQVILSQPSVLKDEPCQVYVSELGESSVIMGLRCWVPTTDYKAVQWDMNEKIKKEFDRAGLHIPYPQMDVRLVQKDSGAKKEK